MQAWTNALIISRSQLNCQNYNRPVSQSMHALLSYDFRSFEWLVTKEETRVNITIMTKYCLKSKISFQLPKLYNGPVSHSMPELLSYDVQSFEWLVTKQDTRWKIWRKIQGDFCTGTPQFKSTTLCDKEKYMRKMITWKN